MELNFNIDESGINEIFDEKGNTSLAIRMVSWNGKDHKLDMRKWYTGSDGSESPAKGFSFLTEEGPHELAKILLDNGYCDTLEALESLQKRDNFEESLEILRNPEKKLNIIDEEYFDPKEAIFG